MSEVWSLWLSRDIGSDWVDVWVSQPEWDESEGNFIKGGNALASSEPLGACERMFGIEPDEGQAVQIRLSVEVIQRLKGGEG